MECLPEGLEGTYERILLQVPKDDAELLRRILLWLTFGLLPLTIKQIWEAVAIEPGSELAIRHFSAMINRYF